MNHTAPPSSGHPPVAMPQPVRVGFLPLSDCAPLVVARASGADLRHGVRIELVRFNSWAALRDALVEGTLDAAHCLYGLVYGLQLGIGGPRHPMHHLMTLSANGQSITVSRRLADQGLTSGSALAAAVRGGRRLRFAQTWPTGTHAMWLYYWLASLGIHPLRDVDVSTVAPSHMVARLEEGSIDGCCVGEPWGALAVEEGVGCTLATSQQVWPGHPEKVLAAAAGFATRRPQAAQGLVRAVLEACRELDRPGQRAALAALLTGPELVDCDLAILLPRFLGDYQDGLGKRWHDAQGLCFCDQGRVNQPRARDALWFLSQFRRWGMLPAAPGQAASVLAVQSPGWYEPAAAAVGLAVDPAPPPPLQLCDGVRWDGRDPEAYAASFGLRA